VLESVEEGDYQVALPTLSKAFAIIDKNVKRGIVHKNTAARKKSQLHLKVKKLEVRVPGELPPANLRSLCLLCL
jgi:small subunit ribosomal protein S20